MMMLYVLDLKNHLCLKKKMDHFTSIFDLNEESEE